MPDLACDLILFDSGAFQRKMFRAMALIKRALSTSRLPYIAFSGGKDSLAVTHLVHLVDPNVELLWSDDELEYPESVEYMRRVQVVGGDLFTVTLGWARHAGWFDPWRDQPYFREPLPGSLNIEMDVDLYQAEQGYDLTFLGLRRFESGRRNDPRTGWLIKTGGTYKSTKGVRNKCNPIHDWTADDVWALISGQGLPYNRAYDVMDQIGLHRNHQRVGPLPLTRRATLAEGWPDLLVRLEDRYQRRWAN